MFAYTARRALKEPTAAALDYEREAGLWCARVRMSAGKLDTGEPGPNTEDVKKQWRKAALESFSLGGED